MELRHLRYFEAVAQTLSFRRAAGLLHVTQPTLSAQIRQLEEEIGVRLLDRDTHHVALTPAGTRFLDDCRRLLQDAEESVRSAQRLGRGEAGRLSIGFVPSLAHGIFSRILHAYRRRFPDIELRLTELDTTRQMQALQAGRIDLALIGLGLPAEGRDGLRQVDVTEERLMAVLPEGHPLIPKREGQNLPLRALAQERFLLPDPTRAPLFNPWLIVLCQQAGFQPQIEHVNGQPVSVLNFVAAGLGITMLGAQFRRFGIEGVRFVPLAKPVPGYRYCATWQRTNKHPALLNFVETAVQAGKLRTRSGTALAKTS